MTNKRTFAIVLAIACASGSCAWADGNPAQATAAVTELLRWISQTGDNRRSAFAIVDKKAAMLYVFDSDQALQAASPVLLGSAIGDTSVPGIGERALKDIKPHERTTPSGRFMTEPGMNLQGEKIIWIDYDAGISMHSARDVSRAERRLERLQTVDPGDNRISYGCINVPAGFFQQTVQPVFGRDRAVLYILPERTDARLR